MIFRHVISAQADVRAAQVKPHSGGRRQNYMPPEAAHAVKEGQKSQNAQEAEAK
jgi:hypothetical protein